MRVPNLYKCDNCGKMRDETNHWWLVRFDPPDSKVLEIPPVFRLSPWNDQLAAELYKGHVCSQDCVVKQLSKFMSQCGNNNILVDPGPVVLSAAPKPLEP
jgi:hypothetical protein